jgi:hypothetical protein
MSERESASCWPWSHVWGKWKDTTMVIKHGNYVIAEDCHELPIAKGTEQERRCQRCNLLQKRIAWNN